MNINHVVSVLTSLFLLVKNLIPIVLFKFLIEKKEKKNGCFFVVNQNSKNMGLSSFDHYSTPTPYCSPSIDRSITTRLIESSNIPPKSSSRFAHTPEWADGLDNWSSSQVCTTKSRQFDFHRDLGLYLPRHEKPNSAPMSLKNIQLSSKLTRNHFPPERIQQLIKKEKDLLVQNDLSNQKLPIDNHPTILTNTFRQCLFAFF